MASPTPTLSNGTQALRAGTHQKIAYTGTAGTIANAVAASVLRVVCTSAAYIKFGTAPTATANDPYVAADQPEYFRCVPGEKVSAIQVSAGGTLHVTEMD